MKNQLSTIGLGLLLTGFNFGFAQTERLHPCNTFAAMEERFAADPAAKINYDAQQLQFQNALMEARENRSANKTTALEYTVPVVFHILHQGGAENITDAQCIAALDQVNRDFAREGSDTNSIFAPFKSLYIDSDIKFMLAKKDPAGNCINGIVRHIDPKTTWYQGTAGSNSSYWTYTWDPTRYLNIYIVSFIVPSGPVSGGGVAGYTYKPGTWPTGNAHDAIVFTYNTLIPSSGAYQARALTHEIGHWLNLSHTFGNTNNPGVTCGDDGILDTPVTKGNYNACPLSTTNTAIVCSMNVNPYYQNVENIMDYSTCAKNFTQDQTTAMRTALGSAISGRSNLVTAYNLGVNSTDVNGAGICAPVADFMTTTNSYTICVGGSLTFKDYSYNGTTSRLWAADNGGVVTSPTNSVTPIVFNTIGTSNVTLTCTNAQGSSSIVKSVTVLDATASIFGIYSESFENALPSGWMVYNDENVGWAQTSMAAYDALNSYYIAGANSAGGNTDILDMPMVNLLNSPGAVFTFAYSYARKNSTHNDVFKVQFSGDCGGSWTDVVTKTAAAMASETGGGTTSTPYVPQSPDDWKVVNVTTDYPNWFSFNTSPHVMIRFRFTEGDQGQGNNFFLDAINITGVTGINELTKRLNLTMYPNPTTGVTNLQFTLSDASSVRVNIVDVLGKEVLPATNTTLEAGSHSLQINKDDVLPKGIYFVNVSVNGTKMSKKLIID